MIKYAALPIVAFLAGCSADVNHGGDEGNVVETLSVNNLVVTNPQTADRASETVLPPPAQPPQTAAPVADSRAARTTPQEPKQQTVRKPSTEAAAKPALPKAAPAGDSKAEPAPAGTCTAEHRALGHC